MIAVRCIRRFSCAEPHPECVMQVICMGYVSMAIASANLCNSGNNLYALMAAMEET